MGGCQNHGPFLGPYDNTAPIQGTQKGTLILTTTHIYICKRDLYVLCERLPFGYVLRIKIHYQ